MTNKELIAALEAADGPSRELDAEIALASGEFITKPGREGMFARKDAPNQFSGYVPPYTSSIDAALTLAKEGQASDVLCDAIVLLNVTGWKGSWRNALPRFIVIAALKAMEAANAQG